MQEDAPEEIIRTSYRTLMQRMKMHPDLGGDHWDASPINEAYATLIDADKRAEYDRQLPGSVETRRDTPDLSGRAPTFVRENPEDTGSAIIEDDSGRCPLCRTPHEYGESIPVSGCARNTPSRWPPA